MLTSKIENLKEEVQKKRENQLYAQSRKISSSTRSKNTKNLFLSFQESVFKYSQGISYDLRWERERGRERVAYETARKIIFVSVPLSRTSQRFTLLIRRFRGPCATMYNIPPYLKNESNKNAFRRGGMRARRTGNGDTDFSFISASWWYVSTEISLVRELWYS